MVLPIMVLPIMVLPIMVLPIMVLPIMVLPIMPILWHILDISPSHHGLAHHGLAHHGLAHHAAQQPRLWQQSLNPLAPYLGAGSQAVQDRNRLAASGSSRTRTSSWLSMTAKPQTLAAKHSETVCKRSSIHCSRRSNPSPHKNACRTQRKMQWY
jgi:hypothetical protein